MTFDTTRLADGPTIIFEYGPSDGLGAFEACPMITRRRTWVRKSATAVMIAVDESIGHVLGWEQEDLLGKTSLDFIHPDDQTLAVENWMQMLGSVEAPRPVHVRHRHRDGSWVWIEMTNRNLLDDPTESCVVADIVEVSEPESQNRSASEEASRTPLESSRPLQLHEALREREQLLHRLAEALPVGVLHVDATGRVLYTNRQLYGIVGKERAFYYKDQLSTVVPEDVSHVTDAFEAALHDGLDNDIEVRIAVFEGSGLKEHRQCTLSVRTLLSDQGAVTGAVATLADVTDSVRMRDQLRLQATFDSLTSCLNRASTMQALEGMLTNPAETGRPAVVFVDLDNFKSVNDHLGHGSGDEVLEIVARRLRRAVREGDVVGRIGGDEFLILCPGISSASVALRAAMRIARSLRPHMKLANGELACRASIGVAWSAQPDVGADTLIGQADEAMYESKRHGAGRPVIHRERS